MDVDRNIKSWLINSYLFFMFHESSFMMNKRWINNLDTVKHHLETTKPCQERKMWKRANTQRVAILWMELLMPEEGSHSNITRYATKLKSSLIGFLNIKWLGI